MADKDLNIRINASSRAAAAFKKTAGGARTARAGFSRLTAAAGKLAAKLGGLRGVAGRIGGVLGKLGGILRGGLTLGLGAAVGGVFALRGAFGAMREAMEGSGGVGGALADVGDQAGSAADGLSDAADQGEAAVTKIQGVFGAFGRVGEGFVQQQGAMASETANVMDAAVSSAQGAADAMDDAQDSIGGATQATTRFGKATNRIANAFNRAKTIILQAIAKAITPALEKFADLLESPAFQKFVDLLAKDLAKAAEKVGNWFINKVIPAIADFMDKVNEAGGPIEFIKGKFLEWKTTALMVLAIIMARVSLVANFFRDIWNRAVQTVKDAFSILKISIIQTLQTASDAAQNILTGMTMIVKGAFNSLMESLEGAINAVINALNAFVPLYNAVASATGGNTIDMIKKVVLPRLAEGGIVDGPMRAIVGEVGPEAITPLDQLPGIIREALGDLAGASITVVVPPGTQNPQAFGASVADSMVRQLRSQGLRMPV